MVYRRFLGLALGLLFVINAIWGSCAHDYHDWEMKKKETVGIGENTVSVHKELLSGFSTARTRKMDLGGKKEAVQKESRGKPEKEIKGFHGKASEDNSGANYSTVKCDFQVKGSGFNKGMNRETFSARLRTPRTDLDQTVHLPKSNSKDSKALPTKTSLESSSTAEIDQEPQGSATDPIEEMESLVDAAREIVNLMNKDYSTRPPIRQPPINNKGPVH
ncbi:Exocyst complex component [Salix suchowensis]|nr:Exocyst complex component [Salix suchowensis]